MINNELLKSKIYDLAFSGKLVSNNKESIDIHCPSVNGYYDIPLNWKWFSVIELFDFVGGSQPPKSEFSDIMKDGYIRLYQTRDYGEKPVPVYVKRDSVTKFTNDGDILLARYGGSLGKVFRAKQGAYNVAMAKVISKFDSLDMEYVYNFFLSPLYQNFVKKLSKMVQAGFNQNDLKDLLIPVPPLEEQKRIVERINELFLLVDKKDKNDKEKDNLKNVLKQKILESAIHGTLIKNDVLLKPLNVEEIKTDVPFNIPSNWKWTYSKCITSNIQYGFTATADDNGNCKMLRITDIQDNCVNWDRVPKVVVPTNDINKYCLHQNDIVVARTGGTVGKNFLISSVLDNCVFASYLIRLIPNEKINSLYLKYYMDSSFYWKQIADKSKGMAQANVNGKSLSMLKIPLPPLEEQNRIVERIESLFELIEQL